MKNIFFLMTLFFFVACANESGETKPDLSKSFGAIYKTSSCVGLKSWSEKQNCSDQALANEIKEVIIAANQGKEPPTNTKMALEFYVLESGDVQPINITQKINPAVDRAVIAFIKKTKWSPGKHKNKAVKIKKRIPILFD